MPITHLLHPRTGAVLLFDEAPDILEEEGIQPAEAVQAIIKDLGKPSFNVRPSDLVPSMNCRRQRVWMETHDYGVDPLGEEDPMEGDFWHKALGTQEIEVPGDGARAEVCGVPMRGRLDWPPTERIKDLKTTKPFWVAKTSTKEEKAAGAFWAYAKIWEPKTYDNDIEKWQYQLSVYAILWSKKTGQPAPKMGRVWRRYGGVKGENGRYKRFDFPLLTEEELERKIGPWMRSLQEGLKKAEAGDTDAWKTLPADGREFKKGDGTLWACARCPARGPCGEADGGDWAF